MTDCQNAVTPEQLIARVRETYAGKDEGRQTDAWKLADALEVAREDMFAVLKEADEKAMRNTILEVFVSRLREYYRVDLCAAVVPTHLWALRDAFAALDAEGT